MKALSIKQPWADLIMSEQKTIESRIWQTDYRGDLLIVSTKLPIGPWLSGYALCIVNLYDCRLANADDLKGAMCDLPAGSYAWLLRDIRLIKPFPVLGHQGFYEVYEVGVPE